MFIPNAFRHPSREGRLGVASRISIVLDAELGVAETRKNLPVGSEWFWRAVHDRLRSEIPSDEHFSC